PAPGAAEPPARGPSGPQGCRCRSCASRPGAGWPPPGAYGEPTAPPIAPRAARRMLRGRGPRYARPQHLGGSISRAQVLRTVIAKLTGKLRVEHLPERSLDGALHQDGHHVTAPFGVLVEVREGFALGESALGQ